MGEHSIYLSLGERISYARKKKGLSQEELAKLIELSRQFIGHMESDIKKPSLETLIKLAKVLEVSLDFLAEEDIRLILKDFMPKEEQNDIRAPYDVVVDKAIDYDVTPEELTIQLEAIRRIKGK